jgi:archaellum component FlaD/FlaE
MRVLSKLECTAEKTKTERPKKKEVKAQDQAKTEKKVIEEAKEKTEVNERKEAEKEVKAETEKKEIEKAEETERIEPRQRTLFDFSKQ